MPEKPKVYIQTFYGFDVFVNGRVIYFPSKNPRNLGYPYQSKRRKRVLAQVVHILYENLKESTAKRNIRVVYHRPRKTLEEHGCEEMLIHKRGIFSIHTEWFECDLYEFVKGNETYKDSLYRNIYGGIPLGLGHHTISGQDLCQDE